MKACLRIFFTAILMLCAIVAEAQPTRIRGRVTDSSDGSALPFAAIFFKGTTTGVSTDMDGYYMLEAEGMDISTICVQILGYESQEREITPGGDNEADFSLAMTSDRLSAARVKPDNRRMRRILREIDRMRDKNNPAKRKAYKCDIYNKMEIGLTNIGDIRWGKTFMDNFGFVFDLADTSSVSGKPYIPALISETKGRRYHTSDPSMDKEILYGSRISGLNKDNLLQQFTGSMQLQINLYDSFIRVLNTEIPSPISASGNAYYNYFLIDSLHVNGRKTYYIRFHPNNLFNTPVFDGEMRIDTESWALVEFQGKLVKDGSVNWIDDLVIDVEYQRLPDSTWFFRKDRFYADFSVSLTGSSKAVSLIGKRELHYLNPVYEPPTEEEAAELKHFVTVVPGANDREEEYWEKERPYSLTAKEQNIYKMVDSVKTRPLYKGIYKFVETCANEYFDFGKVGFGPVFGVFGYNPTEGARFRGGLRTTAKFSRKTRLKGFMAYSTRSKVLNWGGTVEYIFNTDPFRKLTVNARKDYIQLGRGSGQYTENNLLASVLSRQKGMRVSPYKELSVKYEHEWKSVVNSSLALESRKIYGNSFVPMILPDGSEKPFVRLTQAHLTTRMSWNETVSRGDFRRQYLHTRYPIVTVDMMGSVKGLMNDYSYLRTELSLNYRMPLAPAGFSRFHVNAGFISGTVPYHFLKLHAGNASYIINKKAFSCMDYYEFASDRWAELFWEHNFSGFFLGHIPLINKLDLREVFTLKCAWGSLSDKNNGIAGTPQSASAPMLFPEGMGTVSKPYMEIGCGITNILKLFRIDAAWRLTHRYSTLPDGTRRKAPRLFSVNVGVELEF